MEKHEHNQVILLKSARVFISRPTSLEKSPLKRKLLCTDVTLKQVYSEFKLI